MRLPARPILVATVAVLCLASTLMSAEADTFRDRVAPILQRRCLSCHDDSERKGDVSLATGRDLTELGYVDPADPDSSYLLELITPIDGKAAMPKDADPLSAEEIAAVRTWIVGGGAWPDNFVLQPAAVTDTDWWSLRELVQPAVPDVVPQVRDGAGRAVDAPQLQGNPIDAFVAQKHREQGLSFAPTASRRTLIRRLYFDLIGLPPSVEEIERFENDPADNAYAKLVDRLLASPHYGERWARHWLDVVHYGDTHGYDKDKPRPNAWPYRDYVIRSFNEDKPWWRFVQEQVAGDVLFPGTRDGIEALGFIAAGPWDFIGHAEVPESKTDGKIARHLDRDDMVRNTIGSFCSLTVGCAQCHNHKFDPITQQDYYSLQACFAALDRADKEYFPDPKVAEKHQQLRARRDRLTARREEIEAAIRERAGTALIELDERITELDKQQPSEAKPEFGYHSAIADSPDRAKWLQLDLGESRKLTRIFMRPAYDDFNNIGAGFGFPQRFRVELSEDPQFGESHRVASFESEDFSNPKLVPVEVGASGQQARYVRITATKLAPRKDDYIFALAEVQVLDELGENLARNADVTALDSIEAPPRWARANAVDGIFRQPPNEAELQALRARREQLWRAASDEAQRQRLERITQQLTSLEAELDKLPPPSLVYAGTVHHGSGAFRGTGPNGGEPRTIHLLHRGDVTKMGPEMAPGTLPLFENLEASFALPPEHDEGERRAELARWLSSPHNHLTWRSIVNRVWQYHFGRGIVETPNDFGRMGARPTHPELLDWLASDFRDNGQSLSNLHRLIVTSHTYRQASASDDSLAHQIDADNRYLWRMNRRRLEAEAVRDTVLHVSGKLNTEMGGPGFQDFVIEKPEHSPHYQYHLHDPDDVRTHRRSIYRFIVRSQLQPFMNSLDCADPSLQVARRNESLTPLQALAMLNNGVVLCMSKHFSAKLNGTDAPLQQQVRDGFYQAVGRPPTDEETRQLVHYAEQFGMENYCRLLFNLNEFTFVD